METELIKIQTTEGKHTVSGRELHEFLEVNTAYKDWFPRMVEYGFVEKVDFNPLKIERVQLEGNREVSRTVEDHAISIDMAKEICMIQRSEKGKLARLYFIECERQLNTPQSLEQQVANGLIAASKIIESQKAIIAGQQLRIESDRPKVVFADAVSVSKSSILVSELAKILCQNGMDIGGKRLFERLRNENYLCVRGSEWNMPTQRSVELGLFEIKESVISHADGHTTISKTAKVTGKGQVYFVNKYLGKKAVCEELDPQVGGPITVEYNGVEKMVS